MIFIFSAETVDISCMPSRCFITFYLILVPPPGPDQVHVAVEGDVVHRRSPDQDLVHQEIARGVGVVITRDQGPGKAGSRQ